LTLKKVVIFFCQNTNELPFQEEKLKKFLGKIFKASRSNARYPVGKTENSLDNTCISCQQVCRGRGHSQNGLAKSNDPEANAFAD